MRFLLQELLLLRVHSLVNLSIRILVVVLKDSVAIRAIFVLRYVSIVFGLVEVVRHRHYPSYVVDKATTLGATADASWLRTGWSPWWKWLDDAPRSSSFLLNNRHSLGIHIRELTSPQQTNAIFTSLAPSQPNGWLSSRFGLQLLSSQARHLP